MTLRVVIGFGDASIPANIPPDQPTITAGTPSSTGVTLYGSAFSDDDPGDTHATSYWEVNSDPTFYADAEAVSGYTSTFLTQWNATGLDPETLYYARVFYGDSSGGFSPWSSTISFTTAATPVVTGELVDVQVTRLENGTGSGLCSTGIPLPPGLFFVGDEAKVKVVIGGTEQAVYVEALTGRHSDNSVRSILVQFNISCDYGSPLTGTVEIGTGVSRGTSDISKTNVTWNIPTISCTPTDVDYLLSVDITMPTLAVADTPASPAYLDVYDNNFVTCGDIHWNAEYPSLGTWNRNYYDRALCWFTWWTRTGVYEYWRRGVLEAAAYDDWLTAAGGTDPHNQHLEGVELLYTLTGAASARALLVTMGNYNDLFYYKDGTGSYINEPGGEGRIQARLLISFLLLYRIRDTSKDWTTRATNMVTITLSTQNPVDGSYDGFSVWNFEHVPYMTALVHDAFIKYYTWYDADTRIPPSIKAALDFEWTNMWVAGDYSFKYRESSTSGSPDLNGLILMGNIWYYAYSGDSAYLSRSNSTLEGAAYLSYICAPNNNYKQFNQTYRQGMQYFYYSLGSL